MKRVFFLCVFIKLVLLLNAQDNTDWRYDRTGIYSEETGLLKSWPVDGPKLLWHFDGLGEGHSSVAIASGKIYTTGLLDGKGYLFVFDLNGKLLNKTVYGDEWTVNYVGTRSTPVINSGKIYLTSGTGDLVCLDEKTLGTVWKRHIFNDFESKNIRWGFTESPLIIGDNLIITPGGKEHNIVALDKNTGKVIWSSPGMGELSAYCSPLYIGDCETPLIVTMTAAHIIGLEASTGKVLWTFENKNRNLIHSNTPIYANNMVLCVSVDKGVTMLKLSEGGRKAEIVWEIAELDNMMGAMVKVGNYVYGSSSGANPAKFWYCVDWNTGEIKYRETGLGMGVTIFADGLLYCYSDKGEMALVNPRPEKFDIISMFPVTLGTDTHWAHPVIHNKILYIRHGNTLMAYSIKN